MLRHGADLRTEEEVFDGHQDHGGIISRRVGGDRGNGGSLTTETTEITENHRILEICNPATPMTGQKSQLVRTMVDFAGRLEVVS
jgi:hypothetical protein